MAKFRKKPIEIEAIQFDGSFEMALQFSKQYGDEIITDPDTNDFLGGIVIQTLEGGMVATKDVWIITGIKGERYPCKPDIFEATYESV